MHVSYTFLAEGPVCYPAAGCDVCVMVTEDHPRPKPTTIHFSCGPGSNLSIVTLVCTPVCLTGVPFNHISVRRSAARFAAALDNSLLCSACATSQYEANVIFHMSWPRRIRRW